MAADEEASRVGSRDAERRSHSLPRRLVIEAVTTARQRVASGVKG
jgi:hypothetical protein